MGDYYYINLTTKYATDFEKGFEIFNSFTRGIVEKWIVGLSFNRYSDQTESYLKIRLNFVDFEKGKENAKRIIEDLERRNLIATRSKWQKFDDPDIIKQATETATKCSCFLKEELDRDAWAKSAFLEKMLDFELRFESIFLNMLGFPMDFQKYGLSEKLEGIASRCAEKLNNDFKDVNIDFLERFLHHFRNCMNFGMEIEMYTKIELTYRKMLTDLARNKRKGSKGK